MLRMVLRTAAGGAAALGLMALIACGGPNPQTPPPTPTASAPPPTQSPDLLGAPPRGDDANATVTAEVPQGSDDRFVTMKPIPNPEDMSPADRERVYGDRYDREPAERGRRHHHHHHRHHHHGYRHHLGRGRHGLGVHHPARTEHGRAHFAYGQGAGRAAPMPATHPAHPAAAKPAAPNPAALKPAPAQKSAPIPAKPAQPAAPPAARPAAPAPAPAPAASSAAPATSKPLVESAPKTKADRLAAVQAAVGPSAAAGSLLTIPSDLAQGKPGLVVLTLPASLDDDIQNAATQADLAKAAGHTVVSAILSGDGYTIMPAAAQSMRLKPKEAATFAWQVQPQAGAKGVLRALVNARLGSGEASPTISLAAIDRPVNPAATPAEGQSANQLNLDWLSIPGVKTIDVPGFGPTPSKTVVAVVLLILVVLVLILAVRGSSTPARARRRAAARPAPVNLSESGEPIQPPKA
jgi:hypothetical protein